MNGNKRIRQVHRWTSIVFTVTVIACFGALGLGKSAFWVFYLPLPPLLLLMATGLYIFASPYATRWRAGRRQAGTT